MPSENPKTHLGRYELVARIASGGMGEIFLARLEGAAGFEKLYVIKRILPHLAGDLRFRAMLADEARIASKLSHPNICQVYELGETDGELYIVMEYLEGVTLLPLLRNAAKKGRPLELGLVACIIQQIAEALHYAHELRDRDGTILNIVHRDVTPSNIFITESGVAKVLDFGIAKAKNVSTNTQTGTIKGKHAYMAPEQLRGAQLDRRVDVFAVGVLLFEMLALRRLFQRRTDYLTLQAVMEEPIPDVRTFRGDLPDALVVALECALSRDRDQRFATVRQFGAAVVDAIDADYRVWTASNLGDQLGIRFAGELRRRRAAVLAAVSRSPETAAQDGLPHLDDFPAQAGATDDELDDPDLPTIESAMHAAIERRPPMLPAGTLPAPALPVMLPAEPVTANQVQEATPRDRPPPRRSWLWAAFAISLLGIAGTALFLIWRNSQRQQTVLVVTNQRGGGASDDHEAAAEPPLVDEPAGAGARTPTNRAGDDGKSGSSRDAAPRSPKAILRAKIAALRPKMATCLSEHSGPTTGAIEGSVVLQIDQRGKVSAVEIKPRSLADTALATCIKATFSAQRFPEQRESLEITVPFSTKLRPAP